MLDARFLIIQILAVYALVKCADRFFCCSVNMGCDLVQMMIVTDQIHSVIGFHCTVNFEQGNIHCDGYYRKTLPMDKDIATDVGFGKAISKANRNDSDALLILYCGICARIGNALTLVQGENG